jgi:hypothetical protein
MNELTTMSMITNPSVMDSLMRVAAEMAKSTITVPKHLSNKPSDCLAIVMQSAQWGMNPFSVAQKTHLVNGVLGYESQLVNAVVQNSGAIVGRFHFEYTGEGNGMRCRVGAVLAGESEITFGEWLGIAQVTVQNSPLWKTNPKQQIAYLQVKNFCRLYCPGAILGVYSADELETLPTSVRQEKEINPIVDAATPLSLALDYIKSSDTLEKLKNIDATGLSDDEKITLKAAYSARHKELSIVTTQQPQTWEERIMEAGDKTMLDEIVAEMDDIEVFDHQAMIDEKMDMFR